MKKCMTSYFTALVQVLRGKREGAAIGKAVVVLLVVCVALLGLTALSVKVWAACSDFFGAEEIELPFVCTDANDYAPGAPAMIFGFGFTPGETVALQVVRTGCADVYPPWEAVVDNDGLFATAWTVAASDCPGGVLVATAVGLTSGIQAEAAFTDNGQPIPAPAWRGVVDGDGVMWARLTIVNNFTEDSTWIISNCRTAISATEDTAQTDADLDWNGVVPAGSTVHVWVYGLLSGQIKVATAGGTASGFYEFKEPGAPGDKEWVIEVDVEGVALGQMIPAAYGVPTQAGTLPDMTVEEELP